MLTIKHLQPFLRCEMWIAKWFFANAISWDSKTQRFIPVNHRQPKIIIAAAVVAIHGLLVIYRMGGVIMDPHQKRGGFINNIPAIMILVAVLAGDIMGFIAIPKSQQYAWFFGQLAKFEEREYGVTVNSKPVTNNCKTISEKLNKLHRAALTYFKWIRKDVAEKNSSRMIMTASCYSKILMPSLTIAFILISPCATPSFLRSTLSDCPRRGGFPMLASTTLSKLLFLVIDAFTISYGVCHGANATSSLFYVGIVCIRTSISRIKAGIESEKFQRETIQKQVKRYKQVKLLEVIYNQANQSALIPVIMTDFAFLGTVSLYSLIALHSSLSLPVMLLILVIASDAVVFIQFGMYQAAGEIHERSQHVKNLWGHNQLILKDKYLRRYVASCNSIKIRLGNSGNFMEKATPTVITQFTVEQAVGLVLMTNG